MPDSTKPTRTLSLALVAWIALGLASVVAEPLTARPLAQGLSQATERLFPSRTQSGQSDQSGQGAQEGSAGPDAGPPPVPAVSELIPRVVRLGEDADAALETVAEISDVSALEPRVDELKQAQDEIAGSLTDLLNKDYVRDERVQAILERALALQGRVDDAMSTASSRVERLDALRTSWQESRDLWNRWQESLRSDPQYRAVYREQLDRGERAIRRVLEAANGALPDLVRLQQRLQAVDAASRKTVDDAQRLLRVWRQSLLRPTAAPLLSAAFRDELRASFKPELVPSMLATAREETSLSGRNLGVLALQVVLALLFGWALRRLRATVPGASPWAAVLDHPWAIGVLVAATGLSFLYGPLAPLGRFGVGLAEAVSAALVAAGMFANRYKRLLVYLISAAYAVFAGLEAVALPLPLQRSLLAVLTVAGIPVLLLLARRSRRSRWRNQRWFEAVLRAGALALAAIVVGEVAGYHAFAQFLLEASVVTAFAAFVATFLVRLGRGGIQLLVRSAETAGVGSLTHLGDVLTERLLLLLQVAVVGGTLLYLAVVWNAAESVGQAWRAVVDAGVQVGDTRFTVGRLLLAGLAVYLAILISWTLRSLLDRAIFEHRSFDRGVRDSIATLLHYVLIVIGVFVALSVFGVDLSNLALIAGALSVGVGFGLQNVVNNFVSGLILLFERPVRVGDIVVLGDQQGTISKIGMRSTVLTTFNGAELIVPNADLISQQVINWTLTTPRARLVLPVSAAYGNDPARVIELLHQIGTDYPLALDEPAPMAVFTGFGDSSIDFELRVWLGAFDQLLQARSELAAAVTRRFAEEGLEIPFPQRDLHVRSVGEEVTGAFRRGARDAAPAPPPRSEPPPIHEGDHEATAGEGESPESPDPGSARPDGDG